MQTRSSIGSMRDGVSWLIACSARYVSTALLLLHGEIPHPRHSPAHSCQMDHTRKICLSSRVISRACVWLTTPLSVTASTKVRHPRYLFCACIEETPGLTPVHFERTAFRSRDGRTTLRMRRCLTSCLSSTRCVSRATSDTCWASAGSHNAFGVLRRRSGMYVERN